MRLSQPAGLIVALVGRYCEAMKKILELVLCVLHPIAVILIWINLALRSDLGFIAKLTWGITAIVPLVPFVYVLTGNDFI